MPCIQTLSGFAKDCAPSLGGIVEAYFANKADVSAIVVTQSKITGITMVTGATFKSYGFSRETASLTSTWTIDKKTNATYVTSELTLPFNRMETAKKIEVEALVEGELVGFVKDANGAYWFLGYDNPLQASAGEGVSGTATSDRNGYGVTLQDVSKKLPFEMLVGDGGIDLEDIVG